MYKKPWIHKGVRGSAKKGAIGTWQVRYGQGNAKKKVRKARQHRHCQAKSSRFLGNLLEKWFHNYLI